MYYDTAVQYAADVLSGEIPACEQVKQACSRFVEHVKRATIEDGIWYDSDDVERRCEKLELYPHVKGKWAAKGETLDMSPWQVFCTVNIFGFKKVKDGERTKFRMYREAYIEVPRKNGKTFWIAGIGLLMLTEDGEFGAEVYCGATNEKQAFEVFTPAKQICSRLPELREFYGLEVNAKTLTIPQTGGKFEPIIGDPGDGASPSCGIADEFHEHKNSNQVDTIVTGMGARDNPLMLYITTAGTDMGGPCYAKRDDVKNILAGSVVDDSIFGIIYTLDDGDEWDTVEAQIKANPNYDVSVSGDFLEGQLNQARRSALKQVAYRTKHLNQWVGAKAAWMNMLAFQAVRKKDLNIEDYKGLKCYAAFDLASKIDIASCAVLFPPQNGKPAAVFCRHYLPEDIINENQRYLAWHKDGWLSSTPGNVIDFEYIENDLKDLARDHQVLEVPFDPFQATQFSTRMMAEGLPMVEVGATVKNLSEPMKEVEKLILSKEIVFSFDPVLLWMFGNVVAKLDQKDNIFPNKERPENKIDGVVALIMAVNRMMNGQETGSLDEFLNSVVNV